MERKSRPKLSIEQFLNPLKPQSRRSKSSEISQRNISSKGESFTSEWYSEMPEWFKDTHPLAPGGGLLAPPRSYAPLVYPTPPLRGEGSRRSSLSLQSLSRRSRSISPDSRQRNTNRNYDSLTPPWYWTMPQWFRDAHPLAIGGGLLSPGRSNAPLVGETPQSSQQNIGLSSQRRNRNVRQTQRTGRSLSDRREVWIPKDRLTSGSRSRFQTPPPVRWNVSKQLRKRQMNTWRQ